MSNRLGTYLRAEMALRGLSHADVADGAKVHQTTISKLCTGETTPCDDTISRLAVALEVDQAQLIIRRAEDLAANPRPRHSGPRVAHATSRGALDRPPPCKAEPRHLRQALQRMVDEDCAELTARVIAEAEKRPGSLLAPDGGAHG